LSHRLNSDPIWINQSKLNQFAVMGLNHHTAPLHVRERVAIQKEQTPLILKELHQRFDLKEVAVLSTCNRTEIYFCGDTQQVRRWFIEFSKLDELLIDSHLYIHTQVKAVRHFFRVVSGLDSMVLGETQIAGQVKQAWQMAQELSMTPEVLPLVLQAALNTSKSVRAETTIGLAPISMPSVALHLAEEIFKDWDNLQVLLVGAGEMIDHTALYFSQERGHSLSFCNRTLSKAITLAQQHQGRAIGLEHLGTSLANHDVLVCCTGSARPIVELEAVEHAIAQRGDKPLLIIDLAVPRDVDSRVINLPQVHYYCVDDLGTIIARNQNTRKEALDAAHIIINRQLDQFVKQQQIRQQLPDLVLWRQGIDSLYQQELTRAKKRLTKGEDPNKIMEEFGSRLTKKFLHAPSYLMNHGSDQDRDLLLHLLPKLIESYPK
jgi:glutamyl-tRNA reductase